MSEQEKIPSEPGDIPVAESTTTEAPVTEVPTEEVPAENATTATEIVPIEIEADSSNEPQDDASENEPQVIIQQERGFAHYVGFALLSVLCIIFYFIPGIALTFAVSRLVTLNGAAAWIFSAILSIGLWLIFKMKIAGFKKSFYWYIGLCVLVFALLVTIEVLTENFNVFSSIFALLMGAA